MLPSNSIEVHKQEVFPFSQGIISQAGKATGSQRACARVSLFAAPLTFHCQALTQRTVVLQKATQRSHVRKRLLASKAPSVPAPGSGLGWGLGAAHSGGHCHGHGHPTEARPSLTPTV